MKRTILFAIIAAVVCLLCVSCFEAPRVTIVPMDGLFFYSQWSVEHHEDCRSGAMGMNGYRTKIGRFIAKEYGEYYVGTDVDSCVPITDPSVKYYDAATGGNEIPRDFRITDDIRVYIGVEE